VNRTPVTILLPTPLAKALTMAASCAGTLDGEGRVVMDHIILARPDSALARAEMPSLEHYPQALFNGA
jgi:inorganic pyrophosphatase